MCPAKMTSDHEGTITITPPNPSAVVVFLHGLGDTAYGWAETMGALSTHLPHVRFVLPTGARRVVSRRVQVALSAIANLVVELHDVRQRRTSP